jgi:DNA-binding CsgD family transcriptional regulator/tetratricopeptide (TPR) repeat protein
MNQTLLLGRESETGLLQALLDELAQGGGGIVITGDPGLGKTALLRAAKEHARANGARVLATTGLQSEAHLPFAGLHALLRPLISGKDDLPDPQREAIEGALGIRREETHEFFLVALAALELLADAAAEAPVVVAIDDAQWIDDATCNVLSFVGRRIASEPIAVLAALRDGYESPLIGAGLHELRLEPLSPDDAVAFLSEHVAAELPDDAREQVLREAAGNPLALLELQSALQAGRSLGASIPLTERLERAFAERASELPTPSRLLLVVAAVSDGDSVDEVLQATKLLLNDTSPIPALELAIAANLIEIADSELRFRHPLVRSAIAQSVGFSERHRAHHALASVLASQPERQVWHRAAGVIGSDETLAGQLEAAADDARRRGAISTSVAALVRAASLSDDPSSQGRRLLSAAELSFDLGRHQEVVELLQQAEMLNLGSLQRARTAWLRELLDLGTWSDAARTRSFVDIVEQLRESGEVELALRFLLTLALKSWWAHPDAATKKLILAAAERMPVPPDNPALIAIVSTAAPSDRAETLLGVIKDRPAHERLDPEAVRLLGLAAGVLGALEEATSLYASAGAGLRAQGRLGSLAQTLLSHSWAAFHLGDWDAALSAAEEGARLARDTAQPRVMVLAQLVEATVGTVRGHLADGEAEAVAMSAERLGVPIGANAMLALAKYTRGFAKLANGDYESAYQDFRQMFDPADISYHPYVNYWAFVDFAEAAVHSDKLDEARTVLAQLEETGRSAPSAWLEAALRYARPLFADDDEADELFATAVGHSASGWPFIRARSQLAYGRWLRRRRRASDSRPQLRAARDAFDSLGAAPWGERVRQELRASGETSRGVAPARDELTPQELQIAKLAASGLTNREIGQQLYLSHRTVGSHLYRIFPKLGVTERSQLRDVVAG